MSMNVLFRFELSQIVYVVSDPEQQPRQVVAVEYAGGAKIYTLQLGMGSSRHYEFEITGKQNTVTKLNS